VDGVSDGMTREPRREDERETPLLCAEADDFAAAPARVAMGVVLRAWLDAHAITPFELIHLPGPARELADGGGVYTRALDQASSAPGGPPPAQRRALIQAAVDALIRRSRETRELFQARLPGSDLLRRVTELGPERTPTGDHDRDLRYALAHDLHEIGGWRGKIEFLVRWAADERARAAVDDALGDALARDDALAAVFEVPNALPGELLVRAASLAVAGDAGRSPTQNVGVLEDLFRKDRLPVAKSMVIERTLYRLVESTPLGRGSRGEETPWIDALISVMVTSEGVVGGDRMAEALTLRHARRHERGGAGAARISIVSIAEARTDLIHRLRYLTAVSRRPIALRHLDEISRSMETAVANELVIENLLSTRGDVEELVRLINAVADEIRATPIPERERHAARVLTMLDAPARTGALTRILERVEPSAVRRAARFAELNFSGLLSETGGALNVRRAAMSLVKSSLFQHDLAIAQATGGGRDMTRRLQALLDRMRREETASGAVPPAAPVASRTATPTKAAVVHAPKTRSFGNDLCPHCLEPGFVSAGTCRNCGFPERVDNRAGFHLPPGVTLRDRFRVGRPLGQGGFGTTYLGWDGDLGVKVAIKEFHPAGLMSRVPGSLALSAHSPTHAEAFGLGVARFLEEARTLASLRDIREVVVIHDVFEENGTAYLVMELLRGRTLKAYAQARGGTIPASEALRIIAPILRGVRAIHERGLVHRDISPDNIFLTAEGIPKLLDFGAARSFQDGGADLTVILKPGYAPPEQYSRTARQGPWTDVYALCATLYTVLTGTPPVDAVARIHKDEIRSLRALCATVPPELDTAVMSGLAMRPIDRPRDAAELAELLSRIRAA